MTKDRKDAFSLVGIGAAACVACCAGPVLALLGGLGVAGFAGTALIGSAGLAITAAAVLAFVALRRRTTTCNTIDAPTRVAAPQRRDTRTPREAPMTTIPIYNATAEIACTAAADEIPKRIAQVERMRSRLAAIERTADGLLLHFPNRPDIAEELSRFTVDEKACCQFWGFAVESDADQLHLRWDAPPAMSDYMTKLLDFFQGSEPLTAESGLL